MVWKPRGESPKLDGERLLEDLKPLSRARSKIGLDELAERLKESYTIWAYEGGSKSSDWLRVLERLKVYSQAVSDVLKAAQKYDGIDEKDIARSVLEDLPEPVKALLPCSVSSIRELQRNLAHFLLGESVEGKYRGLHYEPNRVIIGGKPVVPLRAAFRTSEPQPVRLQLGELDISPKLEFRYMHMGGLYEWACWLLAHKVAGSPQLCETCEEVFFPSRMDARFCSDACRKKASRKRKST